MNFQKTEMREESILSDDEPPNLSRSEPPSPPQLTIDVIRKDARWTQREEAQVRQAAQRAFARAFDDAVSESADSCEMALVLADDAFVQDLNARFRDVNRPTNVLAFPAAAPLLGDVIIARDILYREAEDKRISIHAHLAHLTVHGTLHLLGFDHDDDQNADKMESLEIAILAELDIANPYHRDKEGF